VADVINRGKHVLTMWAPGTDFDFGSKGKVNVKGSTCRTQQAVLISNSSVLSHTLIVVVVVSK